MSTVVLEALLQFLNRGGRSFLGVYLVQLRTFAVACAVGECRAHPNKGRLHSPLVDVLNGSSESR